MHNRKQQISNSADNIPSDVRSDPEVAPTAKRRTFSKAEKLRILAAADACAAPGDIGAY
jgi:transposase